MKEKFKIMDREFVLDPELFKFNEYTLNQYLQKEAGYYDHFCQALAMAEKMLQIVEMQHDEVYYRHFSKYKEEGYSIPLSEAKANMEPEVKKSKMALIEWRYRVQRIKLYLKSWDKNHENAQSLGHMVRKQMDKLNTDIKQEAYEEYVQHSGEIKSFDEQL